MHDDSWIFSFPFIHFSRKGKKEVEKEEEEEEECFGRLDPR